MTSASSAQAAWYDIFRWSNIKESFREAKERREEARRLQKEKKREQEELLNKNQNTETTNTEQTQQKEVAPAESQQANTDIETVQEQKPTTLSTNTQLDEKTIENLKAEIAALKTKR